MTPSTRRELEAMTPEEFAEAALAVGQVRGCVIAFAKAGGLEGPLEQCRDHGSWGLGARCESRETRLRICHEGHTGLRLPVVCPGCCDEHACEHTL